MLLFPCSNRCFLCFCVCNIWISVIILVLLSYRACRASCSWQKRKCSARSASIGTLEPWNRGYCGLISAKSLMKTMVSMHQTLYQWLIYTLHFIAYIYIYIYTVYIHISVIYIIYIYIFLFGMTFFGSHSSFPEMKSASFGIDLCFLNKLCHFRLYFA